MPRAGAPEALCAARQGAAPRDADRMEEALADGKI